MPQIKDLIILNLDPMRNEDQVVHFELFKDKIIAITLKPFAKKTNNNCYELSKLEIGVMTWDDDLPDDNNQQANLKKEFGFRQDPIFIENGVGMDKLNYRFIIRIDIIEGGVKKRFEILKKLEIERGNKNDVELSLNKRYLGGPDRVCKSIIV